jgi:hypothetical protein
MLVWDRVSGIPLATEKRTDVCKEIVAVLARAELESPASMPAPSAIKHEGTHSSC